MRKKLVILLCITLILCLSVDKCRKASKLSNEMETSLPSIGILLTVDDDTIKRYSQHLASLACYAYRHSYQLILANPRVDSSCTDISPSIYFQKHCSVSNYLMKNSNIEWLMVIDADVLVLNMSKKIESYLPNPKENLSIHMIMYERFNGEIAAGNYLIRNHPWSRKFLSDWIEHEKHIVNVSFHNNDNGVLHLHLLGNMVGNVSQSTYNRCYNLYKTTINPTSYHRYVGCCKCALDGRWQFEHLTILRRGHAFVRDNLGYDMSKRIWSPTDFLLHGQKENVAAYYSKEIDTYECIKPTWKLPIREDAIMTNYAQVRETIKRFDREAAAGYPQSIGIPDITDCWPNCIENQTTRNAFLQKVCNKTISS